MINIAQELAFQYGKENGVLMSDSWENSMLIVYS
jgi:hypothetical protein